MPEMRLAAEVAGQAIRQGMARIGGGVSRQVGPVVGARGIPLRPDVRAPLRRLRDDERAELFAAVL